MALALLAGKGPTFVKWVENEGDAIEFARSYVINHPSEKAYIAQIVREFDATVQAREVNHRSS